MFGYFSRTHWSKRSKSAQGTTQATLCSNLVTIVPTEIEMWPEM